MRSKMWIAVPIALLMAALVVTAGLAGKFHFTRFEFSISSSLVFNGDMAGVGNENGSAKLIGRGTVVAECENNGGHRAPGRNPVAVTVTSETLPFKFDENGKVSIDLVAHDPTSAEFEPMPSKKEAGCPNGNTWTVTGIVDRSTNWTSATVTAFDSQDIAQVTLSFACTTIFGETNPDGVPLGTDVICDLVE